MAEGYCTKFKWKQTNIKGNHPIWKDTRITKAKKYQKINGRKSNTEDDWKWQPDEMLHRHEIHLQRITIMMMMLMTTMTMDGRTGKRMNWTVMNSCFLYLNIPKWLTTICTWREQLQECLKPNTLLLVVQSPTCSKPQQYSCFQEVIYISSSPLCTHHATHIKVISFASSWSDHVLIFLVSYYDFKMYTQYMWPVHKVTTQTSRSILPLYSCPKGGEYEQLHDKCPKYKPMHGRIQVLNLGFNAPRSNFVSTYMFAFLNTSDWHHCNTTSIQLRGQISNWSCSFCLFS